MGEPAVEALEAELSDDERDLLDEVAEGISRRGMGPVALMFLESMKPLAYVSSQMLVFFRPIVSTVWQNPIKYDRVTQILERRGSLELLLRRLEARM